MSCLPAIIDDIDGHAVDMISLSADNLSFGEDKELFSGSCDSLGQTFEKKIPRVVSVPVKLQSSAVQENVARLVSVESIGSFRSVNAARKRQSTPYDSLKMLVKSKNSGVQNQRSGTEIASVFDRPSSYLQHALSKKRRLSSTPEKKSVDHAYNFRIKQETYSVPINNAIQRRAEYALLDVMINADPATLTSRDGKQWETPLHVLLRYKPSDVTTADKMLLTKPATASCLDRHGNTPLHTACAHGADTETIRHLVVMYPEALTKTNFHGKTPLQLSQRCHTACSEATASFLWEKLQETEF